MQVWGQVQELEDSGQSSKRHRTHRRAPTFTAPKGRQVKRSITVFIFIDDWRRVCILYIWSFCLLSIFSRPITSQRILWMTGPLLLFVKKKKKKKLNKMKSFQRSVLSPRHDFHVRGCVPLRADAGRVSPVSYWRSAPLRKDALRAPGRSGRRCFLSEHRRLCPRPLGATGCRI